MNNATPLQLAFFLLPVVLGGICNMIYVKLPWVRRRNTPIDRGLLLRDGKRLFGDHKTWHGFFGMVLFTSFWMAFFVLLANCSDWAYQLAVVDYRLWIFPLEALFFGALWGFGYVLFELPNSFIKRRIGIAPGKNADGWVGGLFLFLDQADSVVGCIVLMLTFYRPRWQTLLTIFVMGVGVHYVVNVLLYIVGLKKQAG